MNFKEAMEWLNNGSKVTRAIWGKELYFKMQGDQVKSFQPILRSYNYEEDIMISKGWLVDNTREEKEFCDIIPFLLKGSTVKQKDWGEAFVYLDKNTKQLVLSTINVLPFIPDFESFLAQDWVLIKEKENEHSELDQTSIKN